MGTMCLCWELRVFDLGLAVLKRETSMSSSGVDGCFCLCLCLCLSRKSSTLMVTALGVSVEE